MKKKRTFFLEILLLMNFLLLCRKEFAFSQNIKLQETKRDKLKKEIAILDKQLKENAYRSSSALSDLSLVKKKISVRTKILSESDKQIGEIAKDIQLKQKNIQDLENKLDTLSSRFSVLLRQAYKNRDLKIWYMYFLAGDSFSQSFRRIAYFKKVVEQLNTNAIKIRDTKFLLEMDNKNLVSLKGDKENAYKQKLIELEKLKKEETQSQQIIQKLKKDKSKYESQLIKKQKEISNLNSQIEKLIRQAMQEKAIKDMKDKKKTQVTAEIESDFASNKGLFSWPVEGSVVEHFGQNYHPVFKKVKLPFNNGLTMAVEPNVAVKAIYGGVVKQVVVMPGYNKCVLIQHGNYFTFYCKLRSINVRQGEKVKKGQELGIVDTINGETQFHFQIWSGRKPQDPQIWLKKA